MSSLSSTSTLAEIEASYDDNASYAEDASATKAAAFVTACTLLLRRTLKRVAHGGRGGQELEWDPASLREQIKDARLWIAANPASSSTGGVKYADLSNFRDY
jgi:hypothetical protein